MAGEWAPHIAAVLIAIVGAYATVRQANAKLRAELGEKRRDSDKAEREESRAFYQQVMSESAALREELRQAHGKIAELMAHVSRLEAEVHNLRDELDKHEADTVFQDASAFLELWIESMPCPAWIYSPGGESVRWYINHQYRKRFKLPNGRPFWAGYNILANAPKGQSQAWLEADTKVLADGEPVIVDEPWPDDLTKPWDAETTAKGPTLKRPFFIGNNAYILGMCLDHPGLEAWIRETFIG